MQLTPLFMQPPVLFTVQNATAHSTDGCMNKRVKICNSCMVEWDTRKVQNCEQQQALLYDTVSLHLPTGCRSIGSDFGRGDSQAMIIQGQSISCIVIRRRFQNLGNAASGWMTPTVKTGWVHSICQQESPRPSSSPTPKGLSFCNCILSSDQYVCKIIHDRCYSEICRSFVRAGSNWHQGVNPQLLLMTLLGRNDM